MNGAPEAGAPVAKANGAHLEAERTHARRPSEAWDFGPT